MAFKIGSTTVINNSSQVDWNRIVNSPAVTDTAATYSSTSGSGNISSTKTYLEKVGSRVRLRNDITYRNCASTNCNCNCRD